jgi:hypothetical protein
MLVLLLLCACSNKTAVPTKTCAEVVGEVVASQPFEELAQLKRAAIIAFLGIEDAWVSDAAMSIDASRATSELVFVADAVDNAALDKLNAHIKAFHEQLSAEYGSYNPDELPKLTSAIIETQGLRLFFIVCGDAETARGRMKD